MAIRMTGLASLIIVTETFDCSIGYLNDSENFYKFENILPDMRRKVNISTLMVFRNQRRRRRTV
jgi:hypothetical protein